MILRKNFLSELHKNWRGIWCGWGSLVIGPVQAELVGHLARLLDGAPWTLGGKRAWVAWSAGLEMHRRPQRADHRGPRRPRKAAGARASKDEGRRGAAARPLGRKGRAGWPRTDSQREGEEMTRLLREREGRLWASASPGR